MEEGGVFDGEFVAVLDLDGGPAAMGEEEEVLAGGGDAGMGEAERKEAREWSVIVALKTAMGSSAWPRRSGSSRKRSEERRDFCSTMKTSRKMRRREEVPPGTMIR